MEFYNKIRHKLSHRTEGFDFIFNYLKKIENPIIVETGCARIENNYHGDGASSLLFDNYINEYGGEFYTVDISEISYNYCKNNLICPRSSIKLGDSVSYLSRLNDEFQSKNKKIDFLYLDSCDTSYSDKKISENSARHHIYELLSIFPSLKKGSLIGVDDNWVEITKKVTVGNSAYSVDNDVCNIAGKGMYVLEYMNFLGNDPCFTGYQFFWIVK